MTTLFKTNITSLARHVQFSVPTALLVSLALFIHVQYLRSITEPVTNIPRGIPRGHRVSSNPYAARAPTDMPDLVIFRRTKKSGSSSILNALMRTLIPLGYEPIPLKNFELITGVMNEYRRAFPRKLMTVHHNKVTKSMHPNPSKVVIVDSIRDGFSQITSYCRHMRHVESCNASIIPCITGSLAQIQAKYRFVGSLEENQFTYIDLPLSSQHPALSTTVMRSVFPNIPLLPIERYNKRNTACAHDIPELKQAYDRSFVDLERQIDMLRKRMLTIAGYPVQVEKYGSPKVDINELMDAAEQLEEVKYGGKRQARQISPYDKSQLVADLLAAVTCWTKDEVGNIGLAQRHREARVDQPDIKQTSLW